MLQFHLGVKWGSPSEESHRERALAVERVGWHRVVTPEESWGGGVPSPSESPRAISRKAATRWAEGSNRPERGHQHGPGAAVQSKSEA